MADLLTVEQALAMIEPHASPLPREEMALADALGAVLAADVASDIDSPPHDKAMMDGYAIRVADGPGERRVIESVFAGDVPTMEVTAGTATRIMTGAPAPAGADAVVPVEQVEHPAPEAIALRGDCPPAGKHIMRRGEAISRGQVVLRAGAVIGAAQVGLLAEVGAARVLATPKPRVGVLPTGAELVPASARPERGQIRNSNGPMLQAAVAEMGVKAIDLGCPTDDAGALRAAIAKGRHLDVLLVSGGVSAGDRDLAPQMLAELGVEKVFHKVAVKPGKPLWFGVWPAADGGRPTLVFGLPGNPVSSYVCFQIFARPLLAGLAGRGFSGLRRERATLAEPLSHRGGRETFLPAKLQQGAFGELTARPTPWRGSADLAGLAAAEGLLHLPADRYEAAAGAEVTVLRLGN